MYSLWTCTRQPPFIIVMLVCYQAQAMEDELEASRATIAMLQQNAGLRKRVGMHGLNGRLQQDAKLFVIGADKGDKGDTNITGDDE